MDRLFVADWLAGALGVSAAQVEFDAASQTFAGVPENIAQDFVKAAFNLPLTQTTFVKVPGCVHVCVRACVRACVCA